MLTPEALDNALRTIDQLADKFPADLMVQALRRQRRIAAMLIVAAFVIGALIGHLI